MKKTPSLFKRDYEGTRLVINEVVEGSEWVIAGKGVATLKVDGTSCLYKDGQLWKRYDRKVTKSAKRKKSDFVEADFREAPEGWIAAEPKPNPHTGHWPGWLPITDGPEDQFHREALRDDLKEGQTYELVGPKIQGNRYNLQIHQLWDHGAEHLDDAPRDFEGLKAWFAEHELEGIVWHHPDGRLVKIKRKDFGLAWPVEG